MRALSGVLLILAMVSTSAVAEEKAKAKEKAELSTDLQKYSYAVGTQIGQSIAQKGIELDADALALAVKDALKGETPRLSVEEMETAVKSHEQVLGDKNQKAGDAFRAANKKKDGVKELADGLQYRVINDGKGPKPGPDDVVVVNYKGKVVDGREFDASERHGGPATIQVGKVVKGWQEVLQLMSEGSKWEVVIPPELAYGAKGAQGVIGPNETLVFEIELVSVKAKAAGGGN